MLDQKFEVLNTKGVHYQIAKILGFENLSLWQRLNSFRPLTFSSNIQQSFNFWSCPLILFINEASYTDKEVYKWEKCMFNMPKVLMQ